jgi:sugar O-acyltransferase (sialic acid O-acetyltransferase NeuD family)
MTLQKGNKKMLPMSLEICSMHRKDPYVIWGSAGHAKVLEEIIALRGGQVIALFDNSDVSSALPGVELYKGVEGFRQWLKNESGSLGTVYGLVAIGGSRGRERLEIQRFFLEKGVIVPNLFHPAAVISKSARVGEGTQILALASVAAGSNLGSACIVNHHASIDHECEIGHGVHLAPGSTLCGCVVVGDNVFVGAGAIVLPRLRIGENSIIGAGAVVTKDVPANCTVMGNPAREYNYRRAS